MPKQAVDIFYKVIKKDPKPKNTYWPNTISNQDLFNSCQQEDMPQLSPGDVGIGLVMYLERLGQHYQEKL